MTISRLSGSPLISTDGASHFCQLGPWVGNFFRAVHAYECFSLGFVAAAGSIVGGDGVDVVAAGHGSVVVGPCHGESGGEYGLYGVYVFSVAEDFYLVDGFEFFP